MIGVFDAGLGGLTVVRSIRRLLPGYDIVYLGDTARAPYGDKSPDTGARFATESVAFLLRQSIRFLILACPETSHIAGRSVLRDSRVPVLDIIDPAVRQAVAATKNNAVGVIGTRATVTSGEYDRRLKALNPSLRIVSAPCTLLVPLVEEGWSDRVVTTMIVKRYLLPIKSRQIDTLILGCSHYPVLKSIIQRKIGRRVTVIDSAQSLAAALKAYLHSHPRVDATLSRNGHLRVCVSDETDMTRVLAEEILDMPVFPERVSITGS